jgi:hypothetical protein
MPTFFQEVRLHQQRFFDFLLRLCAHANMGNGAVVDGPWQNETKRLRGKGEYCKYCNSSTLRHVHKLGPEREEADVLKVEAPLPSFHLYITVLLVQITQDKMLKITRSVYLYLFRMLCSACLPR